MVSEKQLRLSPADTRRLIDNYTEYRFGRVLSPEELARRAGVSVEAISSLLAQKPISPEDLKKIARTINLSERLLEEIAGYHDMSAEMLETLNRFFAAMRRYRAGKKARAA